MCEGREDEDDGEGMLEAVGEARLEAEGEARLEEEGEEAIDRSAAAGDTTEGGFKKPIDFRFGLLFREAKLEEPPAVGEEATEEGEDIGDGCEVGIAIDGVVEGPLFLIWRTGTNPCLSGSISKAASRSFI